MRAIYIGVFAFAACIVQPAPPVTGPASPHGAPAYGGATYGGATYGGTTAANPGGTIAAQQLVGHWTGDWGDLYFSIDADGTARGVYPHDTGTILGRIDNDVFRGWWCEAPSRQPTSDAGDVELRFSRDANGLLIDGRWRYGASGGWRENWDLRWVETPVDAALMARLGAASQFCRKP